MKWNLRTFRRDCLLGALGALLMLAGDLCLSVIPAGGADQGLFQREAYLSGAYADWRFPLLLATGLAGMALGFFSVRALYTQIRPERRKTRAAVLIGGVLYLTSAGVLHALIGSLADWTSTLAPLLGREETAQLVAAQYARFLRPMLLAYGGMVLLMLASAFALLTGAAVLPRRMALFHPLVWQLVLVAIPDIRQLCGAGVSTWDFVLSQGSGNAALFLFLAASAVWAQRNRTEVQEDA